MALNKLNKLFVLVSGSNNIKNYKDTHLGQTNDNYSSKIAFLRDTGEIMTNGQVFGFSKDDISALQTLIGYNINSYKSLDSNLTATDIISAINEIFTLASNNENTIGDNSSGLIKRINDLETSVDTSSTGLKDRMNTIEGKVSTLIGSDTSKSVRTIAAEETAKIVADANTAYDTLKEIADWILNDQTGAANMGNRISSLENSLGNESTDATYYEEGDTIPEGKQIGDIKTEAINATGLYADVESLESEINTLKGNNSTVGSVANMIKNTIDELDSEKTSVDMSSPTAANNVSKNSYISIANKVTVTEVDGKLTSVTVSGGSADAAGAANKAYEDLLGTNGDSDSLMTLYGVKAYVGSLVSNKNVKADGDETLLHVTYTDNIVSIRPTEALNSAVQKANTALQSITISSANSTYITVSSSTGGATIGAALGTLTVNNSNNSDILTYTDGLVSAKIIADAINDIDLWENYIIS